MIGFGLRASSKSLFAFRVHSRQKNGLANLPGRYHPSLALLEKAQKSPSEFLSRHLRGDWGDLCQDDKTENELSLKYGFRLLSSYAITDTDTLWIITEADRSVTTLLLPSEY